MTVAVFDGDARRAAEFLAVLDRVRGLPELATNPRMLTFLADFFRGGVLTEDTLAGRDGDRQMTAGELYELLLRRWLRHEYERHNVGGAYPAMSVEQRMEAVGELAQRLWDTGERSVHPRELGELAEGLAGLAALEMRAG